MIFIIKKYFNFHGSGLNGNIGQDLWLIFPESY